MADHDDDVTFVPEEEAQKRALSLQEENATLAEEVEQLQDDIKADLEDIKHLTGDSRAWFWRGLMQGAGAIVGSILMLILLGWFLSIIGVIPGAGEVADYIRVYLNQVQR